MNRNYLARTWNQPNYVDFRKETAIHEAGHAVAIYIGNRQKQLPPIFFQILIKREESSFSFDNTVDRFLFCHDWLAKVDGGRLIHTLPTSIEEATQEFDLEQKKSYCQAFEADIVNLLVGPLAEAKYVSLRDQEPLNPRTISLHALQYYGGSSDLEIVREYLNCFIDDEEAQAAKISELFLAAFSFIHNHTNWQAIVALADYLLRAGKDCVGFEEISLVIENRLNT